MKQQNWSQKENIQVHDNAYYLISKTRKVVDLIKKEKKPSQQTQ